MTCIVGVEHGGDVWIGSDSQVTMGGTADTMPNGAKVFRVGDMLLGVCGSVRFSNLLRWSVAIPERLPEQSTGDWMVTQWSAVVRAAMKEHGHLRTDDGLESVDGHLLAGYAGELWYVDGTLGAYRSTAGYNASGSGMDFALGSLHSTRGGGWQPETRIRLALEAAAEYNTGVRGPFTVERLEAHP